MTTPGTAQWLRETAKEHEDLAEGLLRAANRIERLQNELGKQKTGVDPSYQPPVITRTSRGIARPASTLSLPTFNITLPEGESASDKEAYDRVFDWINGSERLGMGLLDPCDLYVVGEPNVKGGTWAFDSVCTLSKNKFDKGFVRLCGVKLAGPLVTLVEATNTIELVDCALLDVDGVTIQLVAKEAKDVRR